MTYAVIRVGGKQFMVEKGDKIRVERQEAPLKVETLYYTDGASVKVGAPVLSDVKVTLDLVEDYADKKIRVARFKSKSRYRKVNGHRQPMSLIEIKDITVGSKKAEAKADVADEKSVKKAPKKTTAKKASTKSSTKKKEVKEVKTKE